MWDRGARALRVHALLVCACSERFLLLCRGLLKALSLTFSEKFSCGVASEFFQVTRRIFVL